MSEPRNIVIGRRRVGHGAPCYIVAEIGINHNGDVDLAAKTVAAAASAGVDAVKFQNYRTEDFLCDRTLTHRYKSQGGEIEEPQYDLFKRCEMSSEMLLAMRQVANNHGLDFFSTPTNPDGIADLVSAGAAALKNGSDYLSHLPLIRVMAETGLPTILSVGMATLCEIEEAYEAFVGAGGRELVLLHCVSLYPAPMSELNLQKIRTLQATFEQPVGYSDHAQGISAAVTAVALGACMIEKHFTLDRSLPGPDHSISSDPQEMANLVRAVRETEAALGSGAIEPSAAERVSREQYRLSCVAASDLSANHILDAWDIAFCRPGRGLPPAEMPSLLQRKLKQAIRRGHVFQWSDFA